MYTRYTGFTLTHGDFVYLTFMRVLISERAIKKKVKQLAALLAREYKGTDCVFVGVLYGGFVFLADLVRELHRHDLHPVIDFIRLTSYQGTESTGTIRIYKDVELDLTAKRVLIVDDILDTGMTLKFLKEHLSQKGVTDVKFCVLLDKKGRRKVDITPDYVGFEIGNYFVVGYGLDCDHRYRNLPYIAIYEG